MCATSLCIIVSKFRSPQPRLCKYKSVINKFNSLRYAKINHINLSFKPVFSFYCLSYFHFKLSNYTHPHPYMMHIYIVVD